MYRCLCLIVCLLAVLPAYSQFSDSVYHEVFVSGSGNINRTNESSSYLLNNTARYSVRKKTIRLNLNNNWVYGEQAGVLSNNDFISTLDFNLYRTFPHFYYWGLGNYTSSYSLKIESQVQGGLGAAYNLIDQKNGVLNLSDGILFERSNIFLNDTTREEYHTFRNSLRLQFRYKYGELLNISGNGFLQNSLNIGDDYIIRTSLSLGLKVYKWISLSAGFTYNNVHRTRKENMLFTYGLTFDRFY